MVKTLEQTTQQTAEVIPQGYVTCTGEKCGRVIPESEACYSGLQVYCPSCRIFYLQED